MKLLTISISLKIIAFYLLAGITSVRKHICASQLWKWVLFFHHPEPRIKLRPSRLAASFFIHRATPQMQHHFSLRLHCELKNLQIKRITQQDHHTKVYTSQWTSIWLEDIELYFGILCLSLSIIFSFTYKGFLGASEKETSRLGHGTSSNVRTRE